MGRIRVATTIHAPPEQVWEEVRHIARHVEWMADAEAIRFAPGAHEGVGTTFTCTTRVGPVRLEDVMEVTEWGDGHHIGVRHDGLVTGAGRFTLHPAGTGRTRFTWEETLRYPWWMGGRAGGLVGDRVLRRIWVSNLRRLRAIVEGDPS